MSPTDVVAAATDDPRRATRRPASPGAGVVARGRLLHPYRRLRFHRFGRASILHRPIWLAGPHKISVGSDTVILEGCWLSASSATWQRPDAAIVFGDRVRMGPFASISCASSVIVGDDVSIGSYSMLVDSLHRLDGPHVSLARNPSTAASILVGEGTQIGERVAVLRGAQIGRQCVVGTNSVVQGKIPDHSILAGNPARIVGTARR